MKLFTNTSVGGMEINDADARVITEAAILEGLSAEEAGAVSEDAQLCQDLIKQDIVTERTIVRMDKKAKLSRAFRTAVFTIARRKKDVKFKKLLTIWRMERNLEAYLIKKYRSEALRMAKESLKRKPLPSGNGANSGAVRKAINTAKGQLSAH